MRPGLPRQGSDAYNEELNERKAIYKLYAQAIPNTYAVTKNGHSPLQARLRLWHTSAQGYLALIADGRYAEAYTVASDPNPFTAVYEQERDFLLGDNEELHRNLGELKAAMERVNSEYEKAKEQFDQFMQENGKKLQLYEYMKKVLTALFANADRVLTEEITPEYREKMSKFLDQLP